MKGPSFTRIPDARLARMLNAAVSRASAAAHRATGNPCLPPHEVLMSLCWIKQYGVAAVCDLDAADFAAISAFLADPIKHGHFARSIPLPFDMRPENRNAAEPQRVAS